jgi:DNA recombination protein RmuC
MFSYNPPEMFTLLLFTFLLAVAIAGGVFLLWRQAAAASSAPALAALASRSDALDHSLSQKLASSQADMAGRLESVKGDLRQQVSDRLDAGFTSLRDSLEQHLAGGRREQTASLSDARQELTSSLSATTAQLKVEFDGLNRRTAESLEAIRGQVDAKLLAITDQVQQKLDQNIREGFAQFEKVQQHLKAAEEQLRHVGTLGESINDLNNMLKLPHLRGQFGEASLERLLSDFLPAHMFDLQSSPGGEGGGRADAMINLPDRRLPIDAKFPREQVLALFHTSSEAEIDIARERLSRVMKVEARRIKTYIQPENGTTDIALMYLPSETLYLETIRNRELADWLNQQHVFPVSPNTLLMTLQTIALVHKWYEVASRFEQTRLELGKAQKSFDHFQSQFETVGKSLNKAQEAFDTAAKHLKSYRGKVTVLSGQEQLDLDAPRNNGHALAEKAGA